MKKLLLLGSILASIAGCSGGGATCSSSCTPTGTTPVVSAANLIVTVSTANAAGVKDDGTDTATVTVTAVDANNNVVAGAPVTIIPDTGVVTASGTTSGTDGIVTGTINVGADRSNRTISVVVKSGDITKTTSVNVYGAQLSVTANPAVIAPGATGTITFTLLDINNVPMSGIPIALTGGISGSPVCADGSTDCPTDANGKETFTYVAPATEQPLTVTATGGGATVSATITDSSGTIAPATGTPQATSIQANPSSVGTNAAGSTANQVNIRALFIGASNAPIINARVRFDLDNDPNNIGGTLSTAGAISYSDSNGVAQTTYIPGTRASGFEGVTIRGCWELVDFPVVAANADCPDGHTLIVKVTVANQAVSLVAITDNLIVIPPGAQGTQAWQIDYSVQVTDASGHPLSGVKVSSVLRLPRYYKGEYSVVATSTGTGWSQGKPLECDSEDVNLNSTLESWEDGNADGVLEPAGANAFVEPDPDTTLSGDTTDQFGRAHFIMQYGQNVATWLDYEVTSTAIINGTEGKYVFTGTFPALASSFLSTTVSLPFESSPFGTDASLKGSDGAHRVLVVDPDDSSLTANLCTLSPLNVHGIGTGSN